MKSSWFVALVTSLVAGIRPPVQGDQRQAVYRGGLEGEAQSGGAKILLGGHAEGQVVYPTILTGT